MSTTLKHFKAKHEFQTACVLIAKLRGGICLGSVPQHKSIRSSLLGSFVLILCESLGLSLAVCFTSLLFSSLAVSTSSHARVYRRCSTICPGSPSLLLHLGARVFADTLGDHPIGIGFFSKTSHDHLITCGSESNFLISSADVKIIVPSGTSTMSELFVLVRTNVNCSPHGSVSAHSSSWRMEVLSRALRGSVSVPTCHLEGEGFRNGPSGSRISPRSQSCDSWPHPLRAF